jgi:hypothetical protein
MKLVKKENSEGENSEEEDSEGEDSQRGDYQGEDSEGEDSQGENSEGETRISGKENMGLYQLHVFDELKDHVDYGIANIQRN